MQALRVWASDAYPSTTACADAQSNPATRTAPTAHQETGQPATGQSTTHQPATGNPTAGQCATQRSLRRRATATAVRYTLEELAACAPGHSVEVRVPPYGATQAVAGTVHRRGTPPSVVETDATTWLQLATGRLTWRDALESGRLHASGERCDLSPYLPLLRLT